jgi:thiamine monophosphate synthase
MVTIKIPALPRGMFSNLLGLAGLIAAVVAIGGLTGNWWWSLLAAGVVSVALSYIAHMNAAQAQEQADSPRDVPRLVSRSA